jgi:hypothetical protein
MMGEMASAGAMASDPSGHVMVGCLRTVHAVIAFPVSRRDLEADTRFASTVMDQLGVGKNTLVLLTSGSSEYSHFWPYELAMEQREACVAVADNFIFDAGRSEMFMRRLPIAVAFGITDTVLDGMAAMKLDIAKAFASVGTICARDGAADRLNALGFSPWRMVSFGPTFGYVSPQGESFYDQNEWLVEAADGELLITAINARAVPLVRLRTGVRGSLDSDHMFTLA